MESLTSTHNKKNLLHAYEQVLFDSRKWWMLEWENSICSSIHPSIHECNDANNTCVNDSEFRVILFQFSGRLIQYSVLMTHSEVIDFIEFYMRCFWFNDGFGAIFDFFLPSFGYEYVLEDKLSLENFTWSWSYSAWSFLDYFFLNFALEPEIKHSFSIFFRHFIHYLSRIYTRRFGTIPHSVFLLCSFNFYFHM